MRAYGDWAGYLASMGGRDDTGHADPTDTTDTTDPLETRRARRALASQLRADPDCARELINTVARLLTASLPVPEPATAQPSGTGPTIAGPTIKAGPTRGTGQAGAIAPALAAAIDWGRVCPTVLGSTHQLVRDAAVRRRHGEHYTSAATIRKALDPLIFDELRHELADAGDDQARLHRLWDRLAGLRILDPACGCGDFLVVAYRELVALEHAVRARLSPAQPSEGRLRAEPTSRAASRPRRVGVAQLHGIEIDPESAELARLALTILEQRLADPATPAPNTRTPNASTPARTMPDPATPDPATPHPHTAARGEATIVTGDALDLDWAAVVPPSERVVVVGNPPFRGHKERTKAQGAQLRTAWGSDSLRHLDYATGWFAKALRYFGAYPGRWAFVCTNSVVQGESVPPLFRPIFAAGWRIAFAHRTFAWGSEPSGAEPSGREPTAGRAAVHVVVIGFDRGGAAPRLFDYPHPGAPAVEAPARTINGYLVDGPTVLVEPAPRPLSPQLPAIRAGSTAIDWSQLAVAPADLARVRADPVAAKYLRRFVGGRELINDRPRWCLWMAGPDFDPDDLYRSAELARRVDLVRLHRAAAGRPATRALARRPHLFGEIRQPDGAYLAMPQTFAERRSHATAARLGAEVIASVKLFTAPDPDGLLFALFSSAMFLTWQKTVGGRLRSDPSLSASVVWNTFPVPPLEAQCRAEITAAGAAVLTARSPQWSLARQYSPDAMPAPLVAAHAELDALVDKAFGATGGCPDESGRQRLLFDRYLDLSS